MFVPFLVVASCVGVMVGLGVNYLAANQDAALCFGVAACIFTLTMLAGFGTIEEAIKADK